MLVVLVPAEDESFRLGPHVADQLARLGVTSISLVRDDQSVALVLEGWVFDPLRSATAAAAVLIEDPESVRLLYPLMHMGVQGGVPSVRKVTP